MLMNATILAAITLVGLSILILKTPIWTQKLLVKFSFFIDIGAFVITYMIFSGTATALIAGGLVGIGMSILLKFLEIRFNNNKEDINVRRSEFAHNSR